MVVHIVKFNKIVHVLLKRTWTFTVQCNAPYMLMGSSLLFVQIYVRTDFWKKSKISHYYGKLVNFSCSPLHICFMYFELMLFDA